MLNTQHDDYTHLTAEDWGAWLLAHNHCKQNNTRTLDDQTFLQVSRMTTMETYSHGPDPRKVDTSGVSYAAWVSVADVSASKSLGARRLHQECRLRVL